MINNQDVIFFNELINNIKPNSTVKICVNNFSFNAVFDLLEPFQNCKSIEILIQKTDFDLQKSSFVKDLSENETNAKLQTYYRLRQVLDFVEKFVFVKKGITGGNSFIIVDDKSFQFAPNNFNETTLGLIKDGKPYMIFGLEDSSNSFGKAFENLWNGGTDCKKELINLYQQADVLKSAEVNYKYSISKIFAGKTTEDINEERLMKTGFKNSVVWNKLFNFQKDAVLGAIDKIEKFNGCIIADSVGLGKTFEALAIIKYYELRSINVY